MRSHTTTFPLTSFHRAIGISCFLLLNSLLSITSLSQTGCLLSFGTSTHTTHRPGIGAWILMFLACSARVRSCLRFTIFCSFTHDFGLSLYCITVGHTWYHSISTSILNWSSFSCISISFLLISFSSFFIFHDLFSNRLIFGSFQFLKLVCVVCLESSLSH